MSNFNLLEDIVRKESQEFVEKLFTTPVAIYQKLQGRSFIAKKDLSSWKYFKKNGVPLTKIDRTLMNGFEKTIALLENLSIETLFKIPTGTIFYFELLDTDPKIILSHVIDAQNNSVTLEAINHYAKLLNVEGPPVLFFGKLQDEQKRKILDFFHDKPRMSLTDFILDVLCIEPYYHRFLDRTENIIFKFFDKTNSKPISAKIVDSIADGFIDFQQDKKPLKKNSLGDLYTLCLVDIIIFMTNRYQNYKVDSQNFEEGYIEYICKAYNDFLSTHKDRYRGIDFQEPEFMQSEWFAFNKKFIKNSETLSNIEESEENMKLFKIFLATFNKKKDASKFAHHILSQKYVDQQNVLVDLISSSISNSIAYQVEESFFTLEKKNQQIFEKEDFEIKEQRLDTSVNGLVVFWNDFFSSSRQKKRQKSVTEGESFNLVLGKFQPFHNGHLSLIENLVENNSKKVILGLLCRNKGKNYFDQQTLQEMLDLVKENYSSKIEDIIVLNSLNLQKNLKKIQEKYTIDSLGCADTRIADYEIQCKKINEDSDGINLYKSKISANTTKTSSLREAILENDYSVFKKNTPECLHSYFQKLHQELKPND